MSKTIITLIGAAAVAAGIGGYLACDVDRDDSTDRAGSLAIVIHPDPDFPLRDNPSSQPTALLVKFSAWSVHSVKEGWIDIEVRGAVDLLDPDESTQKLLSSLRLPDGSYDQLRFAVQTATVQVDRQWYEVEIPSGDESGLKIETDFCIVDAKPVSLDLEWTIGDNLHHNDQRGYWLTPAITVFSPPTCTEDLRTPPRDGDPPTPQRAAG